MDVTRPTKRIMEIASDLPRRSGVELLDKMTVAKMVGWIERNIHEVDLPGLKPRRRISSNPALERDLRRLLRRRDVVAFDPDLPPEVISGIARNHELVPWRRTAGQIVEDGWVGALRSCTDKNHVLLALLRANSFKARLQRSVYPSGRGWVKQPFTTSVVEAKLGRKWFIVDVLMSNPAFIKPLLKERRRVAVVFRGRDSHEMGFRSYRDLYRFSAQYRREHAGDAG
ncbi:MAG: hypothetical protein V1787_03785 [Candidatus Micrarchaeota archaeon]